MAKILNQGIYAVMSKTNLALEDTPFTSANCSVIRRVDSDFMSWVPGRALNAFDELEAGVGYNVYIKEGQTVDVSNIFAVVEDLGGGSENAAYITNMNTQAIMPVLKSQTNQVVATDWEPIEAGAVWPLKFSEIPEGGFSIQFYSLGKKVYNDVIQTLKNSPNAPYQAAKYSNLTGNEPDNLIGYTLYAFPILNPQMGNSNAFVTMFEVSPSITVQNQATSEYQGDVQVKFKDGNGVDVSTLDIIAGGYASILWKDIPDTVESVVLSHASEASLQVLNKSYNSEGYTGYFTTQSDFTAGVDFSNWLTSLSNGVSILAILTNPRS
jgi:hypothetical protein